MAAVSKVAKTRLSEPRVGLFRLLIGAMLGWAVWLLRLTWRVKVIGAPPSGAALYAFWHGEQICLSAARPVPPPAVLISRSKDGELGARAAQGLGMEVLRGSSSRGAVAGAAALVRRLRKGHPAAIAVDGPRGPAYKVGSAAGRLAGMAHAHLVPVVGAAAWGVTLGTWDAMRVPAPFSKVLVLWGEPLSHGPGLQEGLDRLRRQAEEWIQQ